MSESTTLCKGTLMDNLGFLRNTTLVKTGVQATCISRHLRPNDSLHLELKWKACHVVITVIPFAPIKRS